MRDAAMRWLVAWVNVYFVGLFLWFALWLVARERIAAVELASQVAIWFFGPIPVMALLGPIVRRRFVWVSTALSAVIFGSLWGGLFVPRGAPAPVSRAVLTVMTYNALGPQSAVDASLEVIRTEQPDVVAVQELNLDLARAFSTQLGGEYPYQVLDPEASVFGMGVISKYPLTPSGERLPLTWIGAPQVLSLEWAGRQVSLVNFHAWPPQVAGATYAQLGYALGMQAEQGAAIAAYARRAAEHGPMIAAGDGNATDLSAMYRNVTSSLADSWREVGFGTGHTWGGSTLPQTPFGPVWIARIDYVFHSADLVALEARTATFDGVSDHRGVVVKLAAR